MPTSTAILSTSPGKYQVLWRVEGFDFSRQEQTRKLLTIAFGGDPACTGHNRVIRVPGFLNRKYDPAHRVTVEYPCDSVWTRADFRLDCEAGETMLFGHAIPSRKQPGKHSNSEGDWAWVSYELAHGKDAVKLTRELASRRSDKPNPLYYAQRTVDVASARLWLMEGTLRVLTPRSDMTGVDRTWAARYEVGDVLRYQCGSKDLGIEKQSYAEVVATQPKDNLLTRS